MAYDDGYQSIELPTCSLFPKRSSWPSRWFAELCSKRSRWVVMTGEISWLVCLCYYLDQGDGFVECRLDDRKESAKHVLQRHTCILCLFDCKPRVMFIFSSFWSAYFQVRFIFFSKHSSHIFLTKCLRRLLRTSGNVSSDSNCEHWDGRKINLPPTTDMSNFNWIRIIL